MKEISELEEISINEIINKPELPLHKILKDGLLLTRGINRQPVGVLLSIEQYKSIFAFLSSDTEQLVKYLRHYQEIENGDYSSFVEISDDCTLE